MANTKKATEQPAEETERIYFACAHVMEGRCIEGHLINLHWKDGEIGWLLCGNCFWGDKDRDQLEGRRFSEEEAVSRKWIPKSRALQFLHCVINDQTCGQGVSSPIRALARQLSYSDLTEAEQDFLYDLFMRGYDDMAIRANWGMAELSDDEEAEAVRLLDQRSKYLRGGKRGQAATCAPFVPSRPDCDCDGAACSKCFLCSQHCHCESGFSPRGAGGEYDCHRDLRDEEQRK